MSTVIDLTGQPFERWIVVSRGPSTKAGTAQWLCRCKCGKESLILGSALRNGTSRSCGCFRDETARNRRTTHGLSKSPEFKVWAGMKRRCNNPHEKKYPEYGGRGIKVCDRWRHDFTAFLADMGPRPGSGYTLERKNTNSDYCPENCIWATQRHQQRNRRNNRLITANGRTHCLAEWADITGLPSGTIGKRLRLGWTPEASLFTPVA